MAMFARSPALGASRPSGPIDPHHPAEYPVLLGDGLKDSGNNLPTSLSMRYNWRAQKSSSISRMQVKTKESSSNDSYDLTIEDRLHKDKPYRYAGHVFRRPATGKAKDKDHSSDQSLALVWDPVKSAFMLEPISASLDFNLTSAPNQSQREISAHKKLPAPGSMDSEADIEVTCDPLLPGSESDSDPDASNPYDFRHFLTEARDNAANGIANAGSRTPVPGSRISIPGSRTPIPGSRTPLPGLSSPPPGENRATPDFRAISGPSTKKRKVDRPAHPTGDQPQKSKAQTATHKHAASDPKRPLPLSSERIIDSDEEVDESVLEPNPLPPRNYRKQLSALNEGKPPQEVQTSPHLIVSDADAELEIDLGSPPPQYTQRKRPHVNPDAFHHNRHRANTPLIVHAHEDVEMTDADVEELELGSPRSGVASRGMSVSTHAGRIEKSDPMEMEDDDDGLAAELEAALEEELDETEEVGLGITAGKQDESEVSEEE